MPAAPSAQPTPAISNGPKIAERTDLRVEGMTCNGCARHVVEALQSVSGVESALVSLEKKQASVRWAPAVASDAPALITAVAQAGFTATERQPATTGTASRERLWSSSLVPALGVTALLMIGEWILRLGDAEWYRWTSLALASLVQFSSGRHFYRGAWKQLRVGSSNMDTLVALGSTTAYGYSLWALLTGTGAHLYFMEAAAIITLISTGHWLEARVGARASSALQDLMNLAPAMARRRAADGGEEEVPVSELRPGDLAILKPGDRIPVDGLVSEGASTVDESMLTGESMPVEKAAGATLYAGTSNLTGRVVLRVTSTGDETALGHIIAAVQRAQSSRAEIQRLGDRVSNVFVPVVVLVAILAALWWGLLPGAAAQLSEFLGRYLWVVHPPASPLAAAAITAAAVLIISCPCAMGLATPAAIMAGTNVAARRGILIRDGVALEKAGRVTAVIFDKTGTLTAGRPEVIGVEPAPGGTLSKTDAIILAASLARPSNHPLSRAVTQLSERTVDLSEWQERQGSGVEGRRTADSPIARLGSLRWLAEAGVTLAHNPDVTAGWTTGGSTILGLAEGSALLLLIALQDALKPNAAAVVQQLHRDGLSVYLVTGDHPQTAARIADLAGIESQNVFAQVRPAEKAALVQRLQTAGQSVAFVGDGINDAPALEQADLGIAVSRASDIAREAADIILLRSEITAVPESLALARETLRTIRQNLFWAFFYNALGIPLAALGFMSPVLCAMAMGLSDLVVIGNALRLRNWAAPRSVQ